MKTIALWKKLAEKYRMRVIGGYDLINELIINLKVMKN